MLLLASGAAGAATGEGEVLQRSFTPYELDVPGVHLGVAVDADGRIFSGTMDGVLVHNGQEWQRIEVPNRLARQVDLGPGGEVYVAGLGEIGVVRRDALGVWSYHSVIEQVPGITPATLGPITHLEPAGDAIYAVAAGVLMRLGAGPASWPLPEGITRVMVHQERVLACEPEQGLIELASDGWQAVPGGEALAGKRCLTVAPFTTGARLVAADGFYAFDGTVALDRPEARFEEWGFLVSHALLAEGGIAIGFLDGAVAHYDADGSWVTTLNPSDQGVRDLGQDRSGGLWMALEGGLARADYPSAWRRIGEAHGLQGSVSDAAYFGGRWFVATSNGVFEIGEDAAGKAQASRLGLAGEREVYALIAAGPGLLAGHNNGLFAFNPDTGATLEVLGQTDAVMDALAASQRQPGVIFALGIDSLLVLDGRGDAWQTLLEVSVPQAGPYGIVEDASGALWIGLGDGSVERLRLSEALDEVVERDRFGPAEGLPTEGKELLLSLNQGAIVVSTDQAQYRMAPGGFVAMTPEAIGARTSLDEPKSVSTEAGTLSWGYRSVSWQAAGGATTNFELAGYPVIELSEVRAGGGKLAAVALNGVLLFDPGSAALAGDGEMPLVVAGMWSMDAGAGGARPLSGDSGFVRSGETLGIKLEAVALGSGAEYRHRLAGGSWSAWTVEDEVFLPVALGDPVQIEIQARSGTGAIATRRISVPVRARWHERSDVRAGCLVALLALIGAAMKWVSDRRARAAKVRAQELEIEIAMRTQELAEAYRKLESSASTDALTEVSNRAALEKGLNREWIRCLDSGRPMAVVLIDLRRFARVNEKLGYVGGDEVLKRVAYKLRDLHDPKRELLARYDGARFMLLMPGVDEHAARTRAEAIKAHLSSSDNEDSAVGVAVTIPSRADSPDALLSRVEAALRKAKSAFEGTGLVIA